MDVASDVIGIIAKRLPPEKRNFAAAARLQDLGIDSLDTVEVVFDLEEKFDIQISYNANDAQLETVADVIAAVEKLVAGKS